MSKAVLISINPKWCELIASGRKTIEVRKTRPKIETPFKCYIYCTKPTYEHEDYFVMDAGTEKARDFYGGGKVIGEFVCDKIVWVISHPAVFARHALLHARAIDAACLTDHEAEAYSGGKDVYGWKISDLVIFEQPKELSEFGLTRAPMSWFYVDGV